LTRYFTAKRVFLNDPGFWVLRLFGGIGLGVTRRLSCERPVVVVVLGQERMMFFTRKYRVATAAALMSLLLVPGAAYPQDPHSTGNSAAASSGMKPGQETAACPSDENERAPLAYRILLIGDACEVLPLRAAAIGFCSRRGAPATACTKDDERVEAQLRAMGKRGETIAEIRVQVLEILQSRNACAAWYQEVDTDPADTFRSLEFFLDENGPLYISSMKGGGDGQRLKQPYVASAYENAGRNATIQLNAHGAFFNRTTVVLEPYPGGGPLVRRGLHTLLVGSYSGNTSAAQVTTMLHELGHIVGRIPEDRDSWDGLSSRNTVEVLHYCRPEIDAFTHRGHR
jgi:hypothetical protein